MNWVAFLTVIGGSVALVSIFSMAAMYDDGNTKAAMRWSVGVWIGVICLALAAGLGV
jgi:hypothetical protein